LSVVENTARFPLVQPTYRPKIKSFARRNFHTIPGFEQQDLEAEILEVLWLACLKYDPDNGACFSTFFWTCAQRRFLDLNKAAGRKMRQGDYHRVWLDTDALSEVIDEFLSAASSGVTEEPSAEDEALALIEVREIFRTRS
jgi:DNA-directed RNA polymerase specialized sigma24 family protein